MELIIDFEFVDRTLKKLGNGWVFGTVEVLGAAIIVDGQKPIWSENKAYIKDLADKADIIVCHNLQCDVGILYSWGVKLDGKLLVDTILLAKLFNNTLPYYNLDYLGRVFYGMNKETNLLGQIVIDHNLYPTKLDPEKKGNLGKANSWAYANMDIVYEKEPEKVQQYAIRDIELTYMLYCGLNKSWMSSQVERFSKLFNILLKGRKKGVRISLDKLKEAKEYLMKKEAEQLDTIRGLVGDENFDPNKSNHLKAEYLERGFDLPTTAKGNPSVTADWLDRQTDALSRAIQEHRKYQKARRDYCDKVLAEQKLMPKKYRGRVYPHYNVLGARTGRFSNQNPNLQQLIGRNEELCNLIRAIYVPEEGETWYNLDFSQQEFRIFAHLADQLTGMTRLSEQFKKNPRTDFYDLVANWMEITRDAAKPVALGRLYGLGYKKLAAKMNIGVAEARRFLGMYDDKFPEAKTLNNVFTDNIKFQGYVMTLGGRRLRTGEPDYFATCFKDIKDSSKDYAYRGVNYTIQGSAADQIIDTWIALDEAGIDVLCSVHDEMNFSLKSDKEAERAREIMQKTFPLLVPMVSDIGKGDSWATARADAKVKSKLRKSE